MNRETINKTIAELERQIRESEVNIQECKKKIEVLKKAEIRNPDVWQVGEIYAEDVYYLISDFGKIVHLNYDSKSFEKRALKSDRLFKTCKAAEKMLAMQNVMFALKAIDRDFNIEFTFGSNNVSIYVRFNYGLDLKVYKKCVDIWDEYQKEIKRIEGEK